MDVHRSRFVPYPTSAISALAFSRSNDIGYTGPLPALKLAIGRSDGNIEIWNPQRGLWVQETVFPGDNRSIDGLAWTQDPDDMDSEGHTFLGQQRLFSIASSPSVAEWDLGTGQVKRNSTGNFSEVWCFAAQLRWRAQKNSEDVAPAQDIIAGCGDGTLVLLSTADGELLFKRFLARISSKRAGCLCVTYQSRERVVAGFQDSMIRIYDTRNNSLLRTMSLGVAVPNAPKNALVWQVRCLPNGDIVSADSNGEVKFWDGRTYALSQRISGHDTDCLDLVTSSDGRTVFSGSMNGKLAVYKQSNNNGRKTWARTSQQRLHFGEVKSMAAYDSKGMSVVVSGGSDVAPRVTPLREFGKENQRSLPGLPSEPPVVSAPKARLVASWWGRTISVWRIARQSSVETSFQLEKPRTLVGRMNLNTKHNIRSVAISMDGRLLAASTSKDVKVFQLRRRLGHDSLSIRKLEIPTELATNGARLLSFSPDGKWLAGITPESEVCIARFAPDPKRSKLIKIIHKVVELDRQHRKLRHQTAFKEYHRTITRVAFAPDSSVLVAGDLSGCLDFWVLEGNEDLTAPAVDLAKHGSQKDSSDAGSDSSSDSDSSDDDDTLAVFFGQNWTNNRAGHLLPKLDAPPLVMTFRPNSRTSSPHAIVNGNPGIHSTRHNPHAYSHELPHGQHRLWVMTTKHHMFELDVLAGRLSHWSRRNPTATLPEEFSKIRDRVIGAIWETGEHKERLWLYGSTFVCMLNIGGDLEHSDSSVSLKKRRKRQNDGSGDDDVSKRRKLESGAGGKFDAGHNNGVSGVVKRSDDGTRAEVDLDGQVSSMQNDGEEDDEDEDIGPQRVRDKSAYDHQRLLETTDAGTTRDRKWWCTFKYRPILGMVPLEDDMRADGDKPLEVVLVERPQWDVQSENE